MASDTTLKILMIGPSGAGKSALLIRYCDDQFDSESSTATIGVDFKSKKLSVNNTPYNLNLLDTAGQERFRTLSNSYYRNAQGVILVYDISNRDSFLSMERWFDEVETNAVEGIVMFLVGSKLDRCGAGGEGRKVTREEGEEMARKRGAVGFREVSSKTREGVRDVFVGVVEGIVSRPELLGHGKRKTGNVVVGGGAEEGSGCAC